MCNIKRWNIFWMDRVFDNIWVSFNFPILSPLSFHLVCLSSLSSVVLIFFPSIKCLLLPLPKSVFLLFVPLFSSRYHSLLYPFTYEAFRYLAFTSDGEFPFFVRAMDISSSTLVFIHFCLQFGSFSFWLLYFELLLCFVELGFYDDEVDIFLLLGLQNKGSWLYALLNWIAMLCLNGGGGVVGSDCIIIGFIR